MLLDLLRLIPDAIVMHTGGANCAVWSFADPIRKMMS
jgi:hypothetical protein